MKVFKFLAKVGQHHQVARALTDYVGKPKLSPYNGKRGQGVMCSVVLPQGVSKRSVDRHLYSLGIPGAVNRGRKQVFIKTDGHGWVDRWRIVDNVGYNVPFVLVRRDGKKRRLKKAVLRLYNRCDCCGPYEQLELMDGTAI